MKRRCQPVAALVLAVGLGPALASAEPISVGGYVVGPDGTVVEGVRVRLETYGERYDRARRRLEGLSGSGEMVAETTPDASGLFYLDAPYAGRWRVLVEAPGYRTMEYRLRPLYEPRDLPALELEPTVALEVRAVDVAGRPVPAAVALYDHKGGRDWRRRYQLVHTAEDGVARFERGRAEKAGFVALALDAASGLALAQSDAGDGSIVLADGVTGVLYVQDAAGAPLAGAVVHQGGGLLPLGVTDAEGRLAIARARDNAQVWILAEDRASGLFEIDFTPGAARVQLEPPHTRRGRIVEEKSGEPIAGAFVSPSYFRVATSDVRGEFSIDVPVIETRPTWTAVAAGHAVAQERFPDEVPETLLFRLPRAAAIRGTVVDSEGRPVAGCDVHAVPLSQADARTASWRFSRHPGGWRARTTGDGSFVVHGLAPTASYEVVAEREGYAPGRAELDALGPGSPALRLVLGTGVRAFGRVIGDDERPVADAAVKLVRRPPGKAEPYRPNRRETRSFPTDAEGRFTAADLGPGRYDLEVSADGYAAAKIPGVEIPAAEVPVADVGGETDLGTVVLERGATIAGRVVEADGHGVAGAEVRSWAVERHGSRHETVESGADGGFVLADFKPGEERVVEALLEGFAPSVVLAVARREGDGETGAGEPLEIVLLPPGRISGRVVDGDGRPVAGASISIQPEDQSLHRSLRTPAVKTDDGGRFEAGGIPAGPTALWVHAEGYQREWLQGLEAPPGGELAGLEIALKPGVSIRGRVTRDDGTPVAAKVSAEIRNDLMNRSVGAGSDAEGHYELMALPPGFVRVYVEGTAVTRTVDGRRGGVFTVDLVLGAGFEVSGHVVDETGRGLGGALLALVPLEGRSFSSQEVGPRSDAEGAFTVPDVQPGSYRLRATKNGFASAGSAEVVRVDDGPVAGVRLVMRRGATLSGTVLGLGVDELAELSLEAHHWEIGASQHGSVDHDGSYRITNLEPGRWSVTARLDGRELTEHVEVADGDVELHRDLEFSSASTLRGTVVVSRPGEPPAPASGVEIRAWSHAGGWSSQDHTDSAGRFRFEGLRQDAGLQISLRLGRSYYHREIELAGSGELQLELDLARLRGQVLDTSTLLPVADVPLTLEAVPGAPPTWSWGSMGSTDGQGRFDLAGIPTARWRLVVSKSGYAQESVEVDLSSPIDLDGLEILLVPSEGVTFQAVGESGEVPRRLMATVFRPDGGRVVASSLQPTEDGTFHLSTVPDGSWLLKLMSVDDRSVATRAFTSPGDLGRLVLRRGVVVALRVPELEGEDGMAWIRAVGSDGQPFYADSLSFRNAGRIELGSWPMMGGLGRVGLLVPGPWSFTVTAEGGRTWSGQAVVVAGEETTEIVLR